VTELPCIFGLQTLDDNATIAGPAVRGVLDGGKGQPDGTRDNAMAHGRVVADNVTGGDEEYFDMPTYTTTMFGSTMAVIGVTLDFQPNLESVRTFSYDEKFFHKLFFVVGRQIGGL
jgi:hypothetical protein